MITAPPCSPGLWFTTDQVTGNSWLRIPPGRDTGSRSSGSWLGPGSHHALCVTRTCHPARALIGGHNVTTGSDWSSQDGHALMNQFPRKFSKPMIWSGMARAGVGSWPWPVSAPDHQRGPVVTAPALATCHGKSCHFWNPAIRRLRPTLRLDTPHCQRPSLSLMAPRAARANVSMNWSARHNK